MARAATSQRAERPARADAIRASGASLLFVGMGTPRQEFFIAEHWERLGVAVAIGVGGSFDVHRRSALPGASVDRQAGLEWTGPAGAGTATPVPALPRSPIPMFCLLDRRTLADAHEALDDGEADGAPLRIVVVIGTRPEAIKLMPVVAGGARAARASSSADRPHRPAPRAGRPADGRVRPQADVDLDVMRHEPGPRPRAGGERARPVGPTRARATRTGCWSRATRRRPWPAPRRLLQPRARSATSRRACGPATAHSPFPEEANRSLTARLADLHFAPTEAARANLLTRGHRRRRHRHDRQHGRRRAAADARRSIGRRRLAARSGALHRATCWSRRTGARATVQPLERICDAVLTAARSDPDADGVGADASEPERPREADRSPGRPSERPPRRGPLGYRDFVAALDGAALVLDRFRRRARRNAPRSAGRSW